MKLPAKGFEFYCGFDICTFPTQYCDTEDKRCGYCSDDICHSDLMPPQCVAECNSLLTSTTPQPVGPEPNIGTLNTYSEKTIDYAYAIAIFALLLVIILYLEKIWKWYTNCKKTEPKDYERVPEFRQQNHQHNAEDVPVFNAQLNEPNTTMEATAPPPRDDVDPEPAIVTNPVDNAESRSHNFGDHAILPSTTEAESLAASLQSNENIPNGPVSHPVNENKCETVDHNILSNSQEFKFGMQDTTEHLTTVLSKLNMNSGGFAFNAQHSELTVAKEQSTRAEKVC